jgi:hypothetical protein
MFVTGMVAAGEYRNERARVGVICPMPAEPIMRATAHASRTKRTRNRLAIITPKPLPNATSHISTPLGDAAANRPVVALAGHYHSTLIVP